MTESEYIKVSDLTKISASREALRTIVHKGIGLISQEEYVYVMNILGQWETNYRGNIKFQK